MHEDSGFSWIAHRLQQHIQASAPFCDKDITLFRLSAHCVVTDNVQAPKEVIARALNQLNTHSVGGSYYFVPETDEIHIKAIAYVHKDTAEWRTNQLANHAILQLCVAESDARWLADKVGGTIAVRKHPTQGLRLQPDDMLNVADDVFATAGREPSRFANQFEFETIGENAQHSIYAASLGGDASGVCLEAAYADDTSLAKLSADIPHRRLGNGLTVRLHLPIDVSPVDADEICSTLNRREAKGEPISTHYGAWFWIDWPTMGRRITYQAFEPNAIYGPGITQDYSYSAVKRARWVDRLLNGSPSESSAWETMIQRIEKNSSSAT